MVEARRYVVRQGDETTPVEVLADGRVRVGALGEAFAVTAIRDGEYVVTRGGRD